MRFKLNNNWSIKTEIDQVTLIRTAIAQKGKFFGKMVDGRKWYWNNFEDALNGLIDRDIQSLEKIEQVAERIIILKSELQLMLKSIEKSPVLPPYTTHRTKKG